ncbi:NADH dehydrogenase [Streptomyces sp. SAI-144]|uniref:NAD(P)/FAD-dependent oxidoreductase n=1 Tax=Streptomyces sp. SAI-144 TaxID=2940544 RepID=UPI0024731090|nr:NAD(P)/FAD-dependent oxidoreductase [Streptomyces sp. SAI-144]MDH6432471.1 NADH dehydrogenase [Streptomyces sp. SAI-144]
MQDHITPRRVVILGGGFAGLFAARALRKSPVAVTVVDRRAHHLFQPLLYQCASGILSEGQIAQPLRGVLRRHHNVRCVLAEATDVDAGARLVHARRADGGALVLPYDELILAVGMRQSYFGHDEFAAHAPGMKTLADALDIRRRIYRAFEMAETAADDRERQQWLTFALVGGGPTGVELAGQIREIAGHTLDREFQKIDSANARVLLFEGSDAVLGAFGPRLAHRAARTLQGLGVELHLGTMVTDIDAHGLTVQDHDGATTRFDARTVLWTAGVEAPPIAAVLARATGAEQDRAGRILVEPDLTVPGHPEIRVTGDVMSLNRLPGLAEVAMQTGAYAGRMVATPGRRQDEEAEALHVRGSRQRRLHRPRPGSRQGRPSASVGLHRLAGLALHPRGLPHRLPQQAGSGAQLVRRLRHQLAPRTRLHHGRHRRSGRRAAPSINPSFLSPTCS